MSDEGGDQNLISHLVMVIQIRIVGFLKGKSLLYLIRNVPGLRNIFILGDNVVTRDREILVKHGITHILNCVDFVCPEYFKTNFVYHTL